MSGQTLRSLQTVLGIISTVMSFLPPRTKSFGLAKGAVVALAATAAIGPMAGKWFGHIPSNPWAHSGSSAGVRRVSQLLAGAADKFTAPPSTSNGHDPLLQNPHQTFNGVAMMLKEQAHQVQLATADHHLQMQREHDVLGYEVPTQRLTQQLQGWWQQMHTLAGNFQKLQKSMNNMLYNQERVLYELQNLSNTFLSNVEMMLQLHSCDSTKPGFSDEQEALCRQHTIALLQDCRNATAKARAKISQHELLAQQVHQQHHDISAGLEHAASSMQHVSRTAHSQQQLAVAEVWAAKEHASRVNRVAETALVAVIPVGIASALLCMAVPPACAASIMGAGATIGASGAAIMAVDTAESALARSAALVHSLQNVHSAALRADRATAEIMEVVHAQSNWVEHILSGLSDIEAVMGEVIDITLNFGMKERRVVLKHLHTELVKLLQSTNRLFDLSSSGMIVHKY